LQKRNTTRSRMMCQALVVLSGFGCKFILSLSKGTLMRFVLYAANESLLYLVLRINYV
jgi:hypothetical protein